MTTSNSMHDEHDKRISISPSINISIRSTSLYQQSRLAHASNLTGQQLDST